MDDRAESADVNLSPWSDVEAAARKDKSGSQAAVAGGGARAAKSRAAAPGAVNRLAGSHNEPHGLWANLTQQLPCGAVSPSMRERRPSEKATAPPHTPTKRRQADDLLQRDEFRHAPTEQLEEPKPALVKLRSDHTPYSKIVAAFPAEQPLTWMAEDFEVQVAVRPCAGPLPASLP